MYSIYLIYTTLIIICLVFFLIKNIMGYETTPFPIDVVYTWKGERVTDNIRDSYNNELQYSLRSIDLYAPWVNKIYILTSNILFMKNCMRKFMLKNTFT